MTKINKDQLASEISSAANISKADASKIMDAFTNCIKKALSKHQVVDLAGFGKFEARARAARTGKNPRTKEVIQIAATTVPIFKAAKALKDVVHQGKAE